MRKANEHSASVILRADTPPDERTPLDIPIFKCFVRAGLVPPMSLFLHAVLEEYGLCLAQLHPNAMQTLAIFQHLSETSVGVMLSVALFRHFFTPRVETGGLISGLVSFCFRPGLADRLIHLGTDRKSTRLNSSHITRSRMPSSA